MMTTGPQFSSRTILYYPAIDVPDNKWLRQALLYWDNIASIVPKSYDNQIPVDKRYTASVRYLSSEGVFQPYNPEWLARDTIAFSDFIDEFKEKLENSDFQKLRLMSGSNLRTTKLYRDKVSEGVSTYLYQKGLASEKPSDRTYIYLQKQVALLYMALLAKHLSNVAWSQTVTGTDDENYLKLSFRASEVARGDAAYEVYLWNLLPTPTPNATLPAILKFREQYKDEMFRFRRVLDTMRDELAQCTKQGDVQHTLAKSSNEISRGVNDLCRAMDGSKLPYILGAIKAFVLPQVAISAAMAVGSLLGGQPPLAGVEIPAGPGATVAGTLTVAHFLAEQNATKKAALRDSDFAYLYLGRQGGIL